MPFLAASSNANCANKSPSALSTPDVAHFVANGSSERRSDARLSGERPVPARRLTTTTTVTTTTTTAPPPLHHRLHRLRASSSGPAPPRAAVVRRASKPTDRPTTLDPPSTSRPLAYARASSSSSPASSRDRITAIVLVVVVVVVVVILLLEHDVAIHPIRASPHPRRAPTSPHLAPPPRASPSPSSLVRRRRTASMASRRVNLTNFKSSRGTTDTRREGLSTSHDPKTNQPTGLSREGKPT